MTASKKDDVRFYVTQVNFWREQASFYWRNRHNFEAIDHVQCVKFVRKAKNNVRFYGSRLATTLKDY